MGWVACSGRHLATQSPKRRRLVELILGAYLLIAGCFYFGLRLGSYPGHFSFSTRHHRGEVTPLASDNAFDPGASASKVFLHIGPHKTGSTAIQQSMKLEDYRKSLAEDGFVLLSSSAGEVLVDNALRKTLKRCFGGKCPKHITKQLHKAKSDSKNVLLSSEQFDSDRPMAKIKQFFGDYGYRVHIVVVYRRFFEWLPSWHQQQMRFGTGDSHWDSNGRYKRNIRNLAGLLEWKGVEGMYMHERYSINAYNNYKAHFNATSWINTNAGTGDVVTNFFCSSVLDAPNTCRLKREEDIKPLSTNTNSQEDNDFDAIAKRAYDEGLINVNQTNISRRAARDMLQNITSAFHNFSYTCPSEALLNEILEDSLRAEREFCATSGAMEYKEDELVTRFESMKRSNKLCSVDTEKVIADPEWKEAFAKLNQNNFSIIV